jgi:iron-sulfur cluster assembly accessory protein
MSDLTKTDPVVGITENAAQEIKNLLENDKETAGKFLRVFVEDGGCSGMKYGLVFDEERDGDHRVEAHGVAVVVDSFSANYLRGSKVDFVDSLTGGGFKILNPNASQSCGCGKSFEM